MDYQYIFGAFFLSAAIIGIFLCAILISEKKHDTSRKLLIALLAIMTLVLFDSFFQSVKLYRLLPHGLFLFVSLWLTFPVFLFFYSQFYTNQKRRFKLFDLLHFAPFIIDLSINFQFYLLSAETKIKIGEYAYDHAPEPGLFSIFFFGQSFLYLFLLKWENKKKNTIRIKWLKSIWRMWMAIVIFDASLSLIALISDYNVSMGKGLSIFCYSFLAYYVAYQLLKKPILFFPRPNNSIGKYSSTSVSLENMELIGEAAKKLMAKEQLYLNKELRQNDLAQKLGTNPVVFSQVLNTLFKKNFNEWINEYRVAYASNLIKEGYLEKYSVEALASQSGYASKASFYRNFKKQLGKTPLEFQNAHLKK